jgi:DNA-binding CsgD family transcriptional regulator
MNFQSTFSPPQHSDYLDMWREITPQIEDENINHKYEQISQVLGQYAAMNNQIITVYNMKSQKVLYISDTYHSVSGYNCSIEDYKKWSSVYFLRDLPVAQSWFIIQTSLWFKTSIQSKIRKFGGQKSLQLYLHNFALSPPEAHKTHRLSLVVEALEMADNGSPIVFLIAKKEVSSFIKEDSSWWAEFCFNNSERYHFHQQERKFQKGSILSEREREILLLIKNGLETKTIADQLDLSTHTVDKHRKNMLERTGAKDTTMLLQICQMGKIL